MFAKKFAVAFAALVTIGLLSGCATMFDPNRQLPPQPQVSAEVKQELAGKDIKDFQVYFVGMTYYDLSNIVKIAEEKIKVPGGDMKIYLTKYFPPLHNPPANLVNAGNRFLEVFKNYLTENGFKVVNASCDSCLQLELDFAYQDAEKWNLSLIIPIKQTITYMTARSRIFYKDQAVLKARDDRMFGISKGVLQSYESYESRANEGMKSVMAPVVLEEMLQAWDIWIKQGNRLPQK